MTPLDIGMIKKELPWQIEEVYALCSKTVVRYGTNLYGESVNFSRTDFKSLQTVVEISYSRPDDQQSNSRGNANQAHNGTDQRPYETCGFHWIIILTPPSEASTER